MSDQIPFHIQEEIIKKLPVKSLIQFRCVSKTWKSLIDSSEFIAAHSGTQPHHLFLAYRNRRTAESYVSFVDDDTFPQQRSVPTLPLSVQLLIQASIVGSSHGLLCFHGFTINLEFKMTEMVVLWNPSIRKSVAVELPNKFNYNYQTICGFGVCPVTNDPKIVEITRFSDHSEVNVFTLSTGKWRSVSSTLSINAIQVKWSQEVDDKFIYWCSGTHNLIMSFDITNENLGVVDLPNSLIHHPHFQLSISKLRESLVILEYNTIDRHVCHVWIMENSVQKSFTKLFTINAPYVLIAILGFRKSGQPIIQVENGHEYGRSELVVYEPNSEHFNNFEICGQADLFLVKSYMETLILLGNSDCSSS